MAAPLVQQNPIMPVVLSENADAMVSRTDREMSTGAIEFSSRYKIGSTVIETLEPGLAGTM